MKRARIVAASVVGTFLILWGASAPPWAAGAETSAETDECLECHLQLNPGMAGAWQKSRHARTSPAEALEKPALQRRVSSENIPESLAGSAVGCAECHTLNADKHGDSFEHNGYTVHTVVTPEDCATCHSVEADQYKQNLMSHAHGNLVNNALYQQLVDSVNGDYVFDESSGALTVEAHDASTDADSCLFCHGTVVEVKGVETRDTDFGELDFPVLSGWPNRGVGRVNPDGSKGSCGACHTRHRFSIEMARKPHTCSECHKGPDVPSYKVYQASKHGNIYASTGKKEWDFQAVPWVVGKDFTAPTCAVCHVSLVTAEDGTVVSQRTHRMNDRLPWRLFGLVYAHPHPESPDTSVIKTPSGLPLPTELDGTPAKEFVITAEEQGKRREAMQRACLQCHGSSWVDGHWSRFERAIEASNQATLTASRMMLSIWNKGLASGVAQKDNIFNESIERKWADVWLIYANHVRLSSAMCGADYGVFDRGRYYLTRTLQEMKDWLDARGKAKAD